MEACDQVISNGRPAIPVLRRVSLWSLRRQRPRDGTTGSYGARLLMAKPASFSAHEPDELRAAYAMSDEDLWRTVSRREQAAERQKVPALAARFASATDDELDAILETIANGDDA